MKMTIAAKRRVFLGILSVILVGGITTVAVSASIPDGDDTIHGCYKNTAGLLNPKGSLRVINSDDGENCNSQETSLNWNQSGGSGGDDLQYAGVATEYTLTQADSEAADNRADLGGPSITVNVPTTPGSLVKLSGEGDIKQSGCDADVIAFLVDETTGQDVGYRNTGAVELPGGGYDDYGTFNLNVPGISFTASPGNHTYAYRYKTVGFSGDPATCTGYFKNMKLWAEVVMPS
jgi:hypothetical protein